MTSRLVADTPASMSPVRPVRDMHAQGVIPSARPHLPVHKTMTYRVVADKVTHLVGHSYVLRVL